MTKHASNGALGISQSAANGQVAAPEIAPFPNVGVPGYPTFLPQQPQAIGSLLSSDKFPQNKRPPKLFEPLTIRGQTFHNRAWVAPMCQCKLHPPRLSMVFGAFVLMWDCADSSDNGHATDHHFVHLGSMAMRGWGLIMVEATAVVPEGRISPEDSVSGRLVMILPQNPHSKPSSTLCNPLCVPTAWFRVPLTAPGHLGRLAHCGIQAHRRLCPRPPRQDRHSACPCRPKGFHARSVG
jgi:hypothetical protein